MRGGKKAREIKQKRKALFNSPFSLTFLCSDDGGVTELVEEEDAAASARGLSEERRRRGRGEEDANFVVVVVETLGCGDAIKRDQRALCCGGKAAEVVARALLHPVARIVLGLRIKELA